MMYVIQALVPVEDTPRGGVRYYCGPDGGFKDNVMFALRFETEESAQRRIKDSVHCRRMLDNGATLHVSPMR